MAEMKCPSCGGTDFVRYLVDGEFGGKVRPIPDFDSFLCLSCGRVELYVDPVVLDSVKKRKEKAERTKKEIDGIENKIVSCYMEMKRLEKEVSEGDASVTDRLAEVRKQIGELKSVKASLLFDYDPIE